MRPLGDGAIWLEAFKLVIYKSARHYYAIKLLNYPAIRLSCTRLLNYDGAIDDAVKLLSYSAITRLDIRLWAIKNSAMGYSDMMRHAKLLEFQLRYNGYWTVEQLSDYVSYQAVIYIYINRNNNYTIR